jgi:hypothetical protein
MLSRLRIWLYMTYTACLHEFIEPHFRSNNRVPQNGRTASGVTGVVLREHWAETETWIVWGWGWASRSNFGYPCVPRLCCIRFGGCEIGGLLAMWIWYIALCSLYLILSKKYNKWLLQFNITDWTTVTCALVFIWRDFASTLCLPRSQVDLPTGLLQGKWSKTGSSRDTEIDLKPA